jgi:hypothetical protein
MRTEPFNLSYLVVCRASVVAGSQGMNRLGFSIGIAALLLVSTVAAAVVWTNLPGLGDPHTLGRYEIDIDGNGVWEVAFEGDGIQFSALVNEHV